MNTRILLVLFVIAALLPACAPTGFNGKWTTDVAVMDLTQEGDTVTGSLAGYGGFWNVPLKGTVSGSILTFQGDTPFGTLAIVLSEDGKTFKSADPQLGFCGSRSATLPAGCGFSGKWNLNLGLVPSGSYAQLQQKGDQVSGSVFGPDGAKLASLDSVVNWGKGWQAVGKNDWGDFILSMTADEKAFQIMAGGSSTKDSTNWCALRDGESTTYVFYFDCTIQ